MIEAMDKRNMDTKQLAINAQLSEELVDKLIYAGYITHPHIATRVARVLHVDAKRYNDLVAKRHAADKVPMWVDAPTTVPGDIKKYLRFI